MRITKLLLGVFLSLTNTLLYAQTVAIKTNALYWATTTPNIGVELSLNNKHTAQLFYGLNPWKQYGGATLSSDIGVQWLSIDIGFARVSMVGLLAPM